MYNIISLLMAFLALYSSPSVQSNPAILAQVNALEPQVIALASQAIVSQQDIPMPSSTITVSVPSSTVETSTPITVIVPAPVQSVQSPVVKQPVFAAVPQPMPVLPTWNNSQIQGGSSSVTFYMISGNYDSLSLFIARQFVRGDSKWVSGQVNYDWAEMNGYLINSFPYTVSNLMPGIGYEMYVSATKNGITATSSYRDFGTCSATWTGSDDGSC